MAFSFELGKTFSVSIRETCIRFSGKDVLSYYRILHNYCDDLISDIFKSCQAAVIPPVVTPVQHQDPSTSISTSSKRPTFTGLVASLPEGLPPGPEYQRADPMSRPSISFTSHPMRPQAGHVLPPPMRPSVSDSIVTHEPGPAPTHRRRHTTATQPSSSAYARASPSAWVDGPVGLSTSPATQSPSGPHVLSPSRNPATFGFNRPQSPGHSQREPYTHLDDERHAQPTAPPAVSGLHTLPAQGEHDTAQASSPPTPATMRAYLASEASRGRLANIQAITRPEMQHRPESPPFVPPEPAPARLARSSSPMNDAAPPPNPPRQNFTGNDNHQDAFTHQEVPPAESPVIPGPLHFAYANLVPQPGEYPIYYHPAENASSVQTEQPLFGGGNVHHAEPQPPISRSPHYPSHVDMQTSPSGYPVRYRPESEAFESPEVQAGQPLEGSRNDYQASVTRYGHSPIDSRTNTPSPDYLTNTSLEASPPTEYRTQYQPANAGYDSYRSPQPQPAQSPWIYTPPTWRSVPLPVDERRPQYAHHGPSSPPVHPRVIITHAEESYPVNNLQSTSVNNSVEPTAPHPAYAYAMGSAWTERLTPLTPRPRARSLPEYQSPRAGYSELPEDRRETGHIDAIARSVSERT